MSATAHIDTFVRDHLPPPEMWPVFDYSLVPALGAAERLNAGAELLDRMAGGELANRPAIRTSDVAWTYGELLAIVNRIAHTLVEDLGLVPGNRVLLDGPTTPMLVASFLAVLKAGGVAAPVMPLLRAREIAEIAERTHVRLALCDARVVAEVEGARAAAGEIDRIVPFLDGPASTLERLMARKPPTFSNVDTAADDPAVLLFTSGTTGRAKAAVHTHRDLLAVGDTFGRYLLKPTPEDVFVGTPTMAFAYGLGAYVLFPMRAGASIVLIDQPSPTRLLETIQTFRPTICFTAPTAYRLMSGLAPSYDLSSLRTCVSAGETLPKAVFEAWRTATGLRIVDGIGSTEMLHIFVSAAGDDIRPGATGKAAPGYTAVVLDESMQPAPPGAVGRLAVRGPTGCRYLNDIEHQRAYVQNGWNLTGDAYVMDDDGYFWYQSRTDDLIVSAGYNIAGPEVENALIEHPLVAECGVVGVPDTERGQIVKAFVVLRDPERGTPDTVKLLQDFVKSQIAPYKYPRAIAFVPSLPRTPTGKLQRQRLRQGL